MPHVKASASIAKPPADVFAYVDDWTNATKYTQDLTVWEPAGEVTHGLGSTFRAVLKLGPSNQESVLEITAWEQDRVIGWIPTSGFEQTGTYTFTPSGTGTTVTLELDITLPGGLAGRILGKTLEPLAKITVSKTLDNLKKIMEA